MSREFVARFSRQFSQQVATACKHDSDLTDIGNLSLASLALQAELVENPTPLSKSPSTAR